jgi:hypothetical protein
MPVINADLRLAAERVIIQRLPTQPLGNKLTMARRGTAHIVEVLIKEGLPQVVEACLGQPTPERGGGKSFNHILPCQRGVYLDRGQAYQMENPADIRLLTSKIRAPR